VQPDPLLGGTGVAGSIKNDLVVQTAGHRQRLGRTDVFDPTGITRLGTCTWSPVSRCQDFDRALRVGQWLVQGQNGYAHRDAEWEHWEDAAIRLVTTALYTGASLTAPMAEVLSWLDDVGGDRLGSALAAVPGRDRRGPPLVPLGAGASGPRAGIVLLDEQEAGR
jgi:hypothetical protein